jgi:hypothetical protein
VGLLLDGCSLGCDAICVTSAFHRTVSSDRFIEPFIGPFIGSFIGSFITT